MQKFVAILFSAAVLSAGFMALTQTEKACVEEKRAQMKQAIENCRKLYTDAKEISICAHSAKQEFVLAVKQCYEQK